jgi:hypothetical protein
VLPGARIVSTLIAEQVRPELKLRFRGALQRRSRREARKIIATTLTHCSCGVSHLQGIPSGLWFFKTLFLELP